MCSSAAGSVNMTLAVPAGSSNHGNQALLCTPPKWYDFVLFFFGNYFAHAATVINVPGQHWFKTLEVVLIALLLPISSRSRALSAITTHAATESDPIKQAARAGALCMVGKAGRTEYKFVKDDKREWWDTDEENRELNKEYCIFSVPTHAPVSAPRDGADIPPYRLQSSYNIPKLLVSFVQTVWAVATLYRARGDQIHEFGYAAFGLTVAQYAFMFVLNIIGNLLRPEYTSLFMIRTPLMDEAEKAGCYFEGEIIAEISKGDSPLRLDSNELNSEYAQLLVSLFLGSTVLAVVGGLSSFKKRNSSSLERGFTVSWLIVSIFIGPVARILQGLYSDYPMEKRL